MNGEGFPGFDGGEWADGKVPEGLVVGTTEPVPGGAENITDTVEPVPGGAEDITDTVEPVPAGEGVAEGPFVAEESPAAPDADTPADWAQRTFEGFVGSEEYKERRESGYNRELTPERLRSLLFLGVSAGDILKHLSGLRSLVPERDIIGIFLQKNELIKNPRYRYGADEYIPSFSKANFNMSAIVESGQLSGSQMIEFLDDLLNSGVSAELILGQLSSKDIIEYASVLREKDVDVSHEIVGAAVEKYLMEGDKESGTSDGEQPQYSGVEYSDIIEVEGDDCEYTYSEEQKHEEEKEREEGFIKRLDELMGDDGEMLVKEGINFEELLEKAPSNYWRLLDRERADKLLSCGVGIEFISEKIVGVHMYGRTRWRRDSYRDLSPSDQINLRYLQEKGLNSPTTWLMEHAMGGSPSALSFVPLKQRIEFLNLKNDTVVEAEE